MFIFIFYSITTSWHEKEHSLILVMILSQKLLVLFPISQENSCCQWNFKRQQYLKRLGCYRIFDDDRLNQDERCKFAQQAITDRLNPIHFVDSQLSLLVSSEYFFDEALSSHSSESYYQLFQIRWEYVVFMAYKTSKLNSTSLA